MTRFLDAKAKLVVSSLNKYRSSGSPQRRAKTIEMIEEKIQSHSRCCVIYGWKLTEFHCRIPLKWTRRELNFRVDRTFLIRKNDAPEIHENRLTLKSPLRSGKYSQNIPKSQSQWKYINEHSLCFPFHFTSKLGWYILWAYYMRLKINFHFSSLHILLFFFSFLHP